MIRIGILGDLALQPLAGTRIAVHRALPQDSYRADRLQFDADAILAALGHDCGQDTSLTGPLILVTSADLMLDGHPFVFGAARPDLGLAVVSTARLPTNAHLFSVLRHEWGHLHGLGHCSARCVMRRALTPDAVLMRGHEPCPACAAVLEVAFSDGADAQ